MTENQLEQQALAWFKKQDYLHNMVRILPSMETPPNAATTPQRGAYLIYPVNSCVFAA